MADVNSPTQLHVEPAELGADERRAELERRYSRTDEAFARVRAAVEAEAQQREHVRT